MGSVMSRLVAIRVLAGLLSAGAPWAATTPASAAAGVATNAHPRTLAIVRVVFAAGDPDPAPQATIDASLETSPLSVNHYYAQESGGTLQFHGLAGGPVDVFPAAGAAPLVVRKPASCDSTSNELLTSVNAGIGSVLGRYDHVMVVFPDSACTWAGLGQTPGRWTWIDGARAFAEPRVLEHELGHNLGAAHATTWTCSDAAGTRVSLSSTCSLQTEYGDPFDVMGGLVGSRLMSSYTRMRIGLLPATAMQTAVDGDVSITDANASGTAGTRLLMIPRVTTPGRPATEYFAIELRRPLAPFDPWTLTDPVSVGLTIRLVPAIGGSGTTKLLDTTPRTPTYADASLGDQHTFDDPVSGIRISLVSRTGADALVRIGGSPLADTIPPTFTAGALRVGITARRVSLSWPAAIDAYGVDHYDVIRDGVVIASVPALTASDTLPVGADRAVYDVRAVDAAGNGTLLGSAVAEVGGATGGGHGGAVVEPSTPGGGGGVVPVPTPRVTAPKATPAPLTPAKAAATAGVVLSAPALVAQRAAVPASRVLVFGAPGAKKIVVKVNGRAVKRAAGATVRIRLSRAAVARSIVAVVASRGTLPRAQRLTLTVTRGLVTGG